MHDLRHGDLRRSERGFTLIELLVVMIILGVLAAVAVPVFLSQRGKAHDSATKADVSNLGKEIATYFVEGTGPLTLDPSTPGQITLTDATTYSTFARVTVGSRLPSTGAYSHLDDATNWCVALTDATGVQQTFRYSAMNGLEPGRCS